MRNNVVVLLLLSLFAATRSRDLHKRYANLEGDGALLDAFTRAIQENKLDSEDQAQEVRRNLMKRWWAAIPRHYGNGDGTLLDAFVRAIEESKLDNNDQAQEVRQDLMKRWWAIPRPYGF